MNVAIVKYNAGNIQSVLFALERIGVEANVTDNFEELQKADKVIFPGVGEARSAMNNLKEKGLDKVIKELKQPVLGICVGMQLLCTHSEENDTTCLGIIPANVRLFSPLSTKKSASVSLLPLEKVPKADEVRGVGGEVKVPQIGWNNVYDLKTDLMKTVPENSFVYYVHSYFAEMNPYCIATSQYGIEYAGAVKKDNFYGVQFHTEKSAKVGEQILKNFLELPQL